MSGGKQSTPANPVPDEEITLPPWGLCMRATILGSTAAYSKIALQWLNTTHIERNEIFRKYVMNREPGRGLITVSNHCSTIDDPALLGALLPWSFVLSEQRHHKIRWSLCAREICCRNNFTTNFFQTGKTLPIDRGMGLNQPIMQGEWLHLFPEGRVGYTGTMAKFKWGIGKLICDCVAEGCQPPIILPFYHSGMGRVLPNRALFPRVGKTVSILVGDLVDLSDLLPRCNKEGEDQQQVWMDITLRIQDALQALERQSPPNWNQMEGSKESSRDGRAKRASRSGSGGAREEDADAAADGEEIRVPLMPDGSPHSDGVDTGARDVPT